MAKPFKVFGIGFNRTGTSSLRQALRRLGYRVAAGNAPFVRKYRRRRISALLDGLGEWEGFADWPWPHLYREAASRFGDEARFVLTRRENAAVWVESLKRHAEHTNPDRHQRRLMLGYDYPHGFEAAHARLYDAHLDAVRRFFDTPARRHLMLECCWEEGDGWEGLCGFLGEETPERAFPWANASQDVDGDPAFVAENRDRIARQLALLEPRVAAAG